MKKGVHPAYGSVVFRDKSAGTAFLSRSTLAAAAGAEQIGWEDGQTYPVVDVDVSTDSHPYWTGRGRVLDTEGRVEKFQRRYGAKR